MYGTVQSEHVSMNQSAYICQRSASSTSASRFTRRISARSAWPFSASRIRWMAGSRL